MSRGFATSGFFAFLIFVSLSRAPAAESNSFTWADGGIVRGPKDRRQIALVFSAHEYAEGGEKILGELSRHHAAASFFLTGDFLANPRFNALVERMIREGHYAGPHSSKHFLYCSWDKPPKTLVTHDVFDNDLRENLEKIRTVVPGSKPGFFLPAFEHYNSQIAGWSKSAGLQIVNFTPGTRSNADYTQDSDANFVSNDAIFASITGHEKADPAGLNGFILLFHLGAGPRRNEPFSNRFGEVLDYLESRGYKFVRIDELLRSGSKQWAAWDGDRGSRNVFIRANQVGYARGAFKAALAFSDSRLPQEFTVRDLHNQREVFRGDSVAVTGSWGKWSNHVELDFTQISKPGCYDIKLGTAASLPFEIGSGLDRSLCDELLEFMRQQRCGYNPWLDAVCHPFDGRSAYGPMTNGTYVDARGGWHDAADLLKYMLTSGNATAQMLLAYQLCTEKRVFTDRVNRLGQSGKNGVPDLLDEARWGLEWMLRMHPAPDQLYHQVGDDRDHIGRRLPQDEIADYGWGRGSYRVAYFADGRPQGLQQYKSASTGVANLAGRYASAMALAYQIWSRGKENDRVFARRCLQAGREVFEMGLRKEGVQQGNSYKAPYRYEETTWADDMEWGAAELFRATNEKRFLALAKHYAVLAADENWMGRAKTGHYQYYPFVNVGHFRLYDLVDRKFGAVLARYYRDGIERCEGSAAKNPYRAGVPFIWCSNNLMVALVTQCLLYERMTGDNSHTAFASKQHDWLLGRNPWGYSMFMNIGSVSPTSTHLMTAQLTHRQVRGGLVDGPVYDSIFKSLKGVTISEPDSLAQFQGATVFHDDVQDYSTDEPTMDGTASAILMFALDASR
jgi:peptidoglycan/xylan/chitin deacetylase (PgdA/CDA1 family)